MPDLINPTAYVIAESRHVIGAGKSHLSTDCPNNASCPIWVWTHPLPKLTALELIEQTERRNFRTQGDLGANPVVMQLWNGTRRDAGLPPIKLSDLPVAGGPDWVEFDYPRMPR